VQTQGDDAHDRVCIPCTGDNWRPEAKHRIETCQPRTLCQAGEFALAQGSLSTDRVCQDCPQSKLTCHRHRLST
jgi:hypothetical protein